MAFDPTPEQLAILAHNPRRSARVLAGTGTGKSTTMVALLGQLAERDPSLRVRMLTFTRAATAELAEKIEINPDAFERPSTIHSFAISVLLANPGTGGLPEPLRIADSWEDKNIVRPSLATRVGVGVRRLDKLIREMASNWESLAEREQPAIDAAERTRFRGAWTEHRRVLGYTLLAELPDSLRRALESHDDLDGIDYDVLIVDEYQDLNACDLEVLRLLGDKADCVIIGTGDDDQSIYSWRNAAPEGIRRFPDDYENSDDYSLSVTLRCGQEVVAWANHVIQGDPDRPADRDVLRPAPACDPGDVKLLSFSSERAEARGIGELVEMMIRDGIEPRDILVLVRTDNNGTFSRPIREEIERRGIECTDPSLIKTLLGQRDNRLLLELFRLLVNRTDSLAWASILRLADGVGDTFFEYVYDRAKVAGTTFAAELLDLFAKGFPDAPSSAARAGEVIADDLSWLDLTTLPDDQPEGGWGNWIVQQATATPELPQPSDEFVDLVSSLDVITEGQDSLGRFLGQIEPLGKDLAQSESDGVRIMTMGAAKGLTVRATIIAGVEDGLIPRPDSDLSEERRILYVGMTRARERLVCTWATRRRGPTARAGTPSMRRRRHSDFLIDGPVESQDGKSFLEGLGDG